MYYLLLIPALVFFIFSTWLNSSGFYIILIFAELPLLSAALEFHKPEFLKIQSWGAAFRRVNYTLLFLFFLGYILLIPASAYEGWLLLLSAGKHSGNISLAFLIPGTLFSSLGCSRFILGKERLNELLLLLILINLVILIVVPALPAILIFGLLLLLIMMKNIPGGTRIKLLPLIFILILTAGVAGRFIPPGDREGSGSPAVDALSRALHETLLTVLPDFPLIFHVPGYGDSYEKGRFSGEKPLLSSKPLFAVKGIPAKCSIFEQTSPTAIKMVGG
ncbi:MAG: hypothetical protein JEY99_14910 [Spirochaetales bacterium]|nr:hypothetical protein [Spirochaetales bacterium]